MIIFEQLHEILGSLTWFGNVYCREYSSIIKLSAWFATIAASFAVFYFPATKKNQIIVYLLLGLALLAGAIYKIDEILFWDTSGPIITVFIVVVPLLIMFASFKTYSDLKTINIFLRVALGVIFCFAAVFYVRVFIIGRVFSMDALVNWGSTTY